MIETGRGGIKTRSKKITEAEVVIETISRKMIETGVGVHQESAVSPVSFVVVMDVLSEEIRNEELWELLDEDDLVITSEKEVDFQRRVVEWQETFERRGLRVNMDKTEVIVTNKELTMVEDLPDADGSLGLRGTLAGIASARALLIDDCIISRLRSRCLASSANKIGILK
ncbi:uncharacterized protein [Palaemon carinicauda]|uniref:uncharacterized protein n=1 Tax=Palaemon carinicauda TaxID=392227 RepID=UPI0035B5A040